MAQLRANNRYYVVTYPPGKDILDLVVENENSLRTNLTNTLTVVKLPEDDQAFHPELSGFTSYSHEEIKTLMLTPNWNINDEQ